MRTYHVQHNNVTLARQGAKYYARHMLNIRNCVHTKYFAMIFFLFLKNEYHGFWFNHNKSLCILNPFKKIYRITRAGQPTATRATWTIAKYEAPLALINSVFITLTFVYSKPWRNWYIQCTNVRRVLRYFGCQPMPYFEVCIPIWVFLSFYYAFFLEYQSFLRCFFFVLFSLRALFITIFSRRVYLQFQFTNCIFVRFFFFGW